MFLKQIKHTTVARGTRRNEKDFYIKPSTRPFCYSTNRSKKKNQINKYKIEEYRNKMQKKKQRITKEQHTYTTQHTHI